MVCRHVERFFLSRLHSAGKVSDLEDSEFEHEHDRVHFLSQQFPSPSVAVYEMYGFMVPLFYRVKPN